MAKKNRHKRKKQNNDTMVNPDFAKTEDMDTAELESTGIADEDLIDTDIEEDDITDDEMLDDSDGAMNDAITDQTIDEETMNTDAAMMGLTTADADDEADTLLNQTGNSGEKSKMNEHNNQSTTEHTEQLPANIGYTGDATHQTTGQSGSQSTGEASGQWGTSSGNVGETVQGTVDQARQVASNLTEQAKQKVSEGVDQAKRQAKSTLDEQKSRTAEQLGGIAGALRQTGEQLQEQDNAMVAQYAQGAADQIERFSNYLQTADISELWREAQNLARRQPELFVAGALASGFLLARFLKSSSAQSYNYGSTNRTRNWNEPQRPYKHSTDDAVARMDFESPAPQNISVAEEI